MKTLIAEGLAFKLLFSFIYFLKLCYTSAIKIVQVIKNIFFETGFVIDNKPPFKKENSYT